MPVYKKLRTILIAAVAPLGFSVILLASSSAPAKAVTTYNYYVDPATGSDSNAGTTLAKPFRTLSKAQTAVEGVNQKSGTGNINVNLASGTYPNASGLSFTSRDSAPSGYQIVWQAENGAAPVVEGGQAITGWSLYNSQYNIWRAPAQSLYFRQMYVNGVRAIRVRNPIPTPGAADKGPYLTGLTWDAANQSIDIPAANINTAWTNLTSSTNGVEMVINRHWQTVRTLISSVSVSNGIAYIKPTAATASLLFGSNYAEFFDSNANYYFENAPDFMYVSSPGQFWVDPVANLVYYQPRAGENMSTASIIAPVATRVLSVNGANNLYFKWITFQDSNYLPADGASVELQSNFMFSGTSWQTQAIPGGVLVQNANGINFQHCNVQNMGGAGIELASATNGANIYECNVDNTAGNGIEVYTDANNVPGSNGILLSHGSVNDTINGCFVFNCGCDYTGASAIVATYPSGINITQNQIRNCPFNGVSVGWGWTSNQTCLANNSIAGNDIGYVMQLHDDSAGIYTLSDQPGTVIQNNYIHNILRSGWAEMNGMGGIYLDQGSNNITVQNNSIDYNIEERVHLNTTSVGANVISNNTVPIPSVISAAGPGNYGGGAIVVPNTSTTIGGYFVNLQSGCYLLNGQYMANANGSGFLTMQGDGNFCIYSGTPNNNTGYVWGTGYTSALLAAYPGGYSGPTFATITYDGHIKTYTGTPQSPGILMWTSSTNPAPGNSEYFLALNYSPTNGVLENGWDQTCMLAGWEWDTYNVGTGY